MKSQEIIEKLEATILGRELSYIENFILDSSLQNKTYNQMTEESNYRDSYLREIGASLWQELSQKLGNKVTKSNLILIIKKFLDFKNTSIAQSPAISKLETRDRSENQYITDNILSINPPSMFSNSFKYIDRPYIENLAYREIQKSDCLLRISAPQQMGISFFTAKILHKAEELGYQTLVIDLEEADTSKFIDLNTFLYWFCCHTESLRGGLVESQNYWDDEIASKMNCRLYWEKFILSQSVRPLVTVIENLHLIFEYPHIAGDFLSMLRHWYERAKQSKPWQRMRLIVTHTTEIYASLKLDSSPFNVGLSLKLPPFNFEETKLLVNSYNLELTPAQNSQIEHLHYLVGGHPYLLNIAFLCLSRRQISLSDLLETAPTLTGIYSSYLRKRLAIIQKQPQLIDAFKKVLNTKSNVQISAIFAYKLQSMGLIVLEGEKARISCPLYQQYFQKELNLIKRETTNKVPKVTALNDNKRLVENLLKNIDRLTLLPNKEYFLYHLESEWRGWIETKASLSLIICDLDYLDFYNQAYGYSSGDRCLQLVANKIQDVVEDLVSIVSRYGGTQFAISLPNIELDLATTLGEIICQEIRNLEIPHNRSKVVKLPKKIVTASLGIATIHPSYETAPTALLAAAQNCVSKSKNKGRDCITSIKYQPLKMATRSL